MLISNFINLARSDRLMELCQEMLFFKVEAS